jgi:hypothetical protein
MSRRGHGDGGIDQRGEDSWRLRYRINGKRYSKAFRGTLSEARKELRALIRFGDTGTHVEPDRITVAEWIGRWIAAGAPGRSRKKAGRRTVERYEQLLRCRVTPTLGPRRLQQLQAAEIDDLYLTLAGRLKPQTAHHAHIVLGACLGTATRKGTR